MPVRSNTGGGASTLKDTAVEADVRYPKTFHAGKGSKPKKGSMKDCQVTDVIPGHDDIVIPSNTYIAEDIVVHGDIDLASENIKGGKGIFGVPGKPSVVDTENSVLDADKMAKGQTGFKNGHQVDGNLDEIADKEVVLSNGQSMSIARGIHSGGSIVRAKSLEEATKNGTLTSNGQLLKGVIAISKGKEYTGDMPDNGRIGSVVLKCGESKGIPYGFTQGGDVKAETLAAQTKVDAGKIAIDATHMPAGYQGWVNGKLITGSSAVPGERILAGTTICGTAGRVTCNSVLGFSVAIYSGRQVRLRWQNPYIASGKPFHGVFINYSTSPNPGYGGTRIYTGCGSSSVAGAWSEAIVTLPSYSTTYYFSCTSYVSFFIDGSWFTDSYGSTIHSGGITTSAPPCSHCNNCYNCGDCDSCYDSCDGCGGDCGGNCDSSICCQGG